jgi:DNA-binding GntR family transcriptional regulator
MRWTDGTANSFPTHHANRYPGQPVGRRNLTQEIYRQLRAAILDGRFRAGDRLPATRELAQRLAVEEGLARLRAAFSRRDSR